LLCKGTLNSNRCTVNGYYNYTVIATLDVQSACPVCVMEHVRTAVTTVTAFAANVADIAYVRTAVATIGAFAANVANVTHIWKDKACGYKVGTVESFKLRVGEVAVANCRAMFKEQGSKAAGLPAYTEIRHESTLCHPTGIGRFYCCPVDKVAFVEGHPEEGCGHGTKLNGSGGVEIVADEAEVYNDWFYGVRTYALAAVKAFAAIRAKVLTFVRRCEPFVTNQAVTTHLYRVVDTVNSYKLNKCAVACSYLKFAVNVETHVVSAAD